MEKNNLDGSYERYELNPLNLPTISDDEKRKIESMSDEEIDFSDNPELDNNFFDKGLQWDSHAFKNEWLGSHVPSKIDNDEAFFLWSQKLAGTSGAFDTFWNEKGSSFLHRFYPEAFDLFSTFENRLADPLLEGLSVQKNLSKSIGRNDWPWSIHELEAMGSIGLEYDTKENSIKADHSVIKFGLVNPMEHLALLFFLLKKALGVYLSLEQRKVFLIPTHPQALNSTEKWNFEISLTEESDTFLTALSRNINLGSVRILVPKLFDSWLGMRKAYDSRDRWKSFVRFDEVMEFSKKENPFYILNQPIPRFHRVKKGSEIHFVSSEMVA